jgi:uncharacterized membrane protein (UPF0127 family)
VFLRSQCGHNESVIRLVLVLILLAGCSSPVVAPASTATTPVTTTPIDAGDLGPVSVATVVVDGRDLDVAVVSTAGDRSQGLRGVVDLGALDGMLFTWGGETVSSRFTMADTVIPLDIAFFDADGEFVDGFTMVPCDVAPCRSYAAAAPYAYALESPAGSLTGIGPDSVLDFPG